MRWCTADLCDHHIDELQVAEPLFQAYGGRPAFRGPAVTLAVFEDNSLVREALEGPGDGQVLVVDGAGSVRCALVGDMLAQIAIDNGWAGIVVHGAVRDSRVISQMPLGLRALATCPRKSVKRGQGRRDTEVTFAGVSIRSGDWIYVDEDGLLVAPRELSLPNP